MILSCAAGRTIEATQVSHPAATLLRESTADFDVKHPLRRVVNASIGRKVSLLRGSSWEGAESRAIAAVRGALMLVAQAAQHQRGGSGEAIIATRFRAALSAMQATVLSLYFLILSRVLR